MTDAELLQAYKDTGLEPEEIKAMYETFAAVGAPLWKIKELYDAECEGLLIVLPCKVGDTVYWIRGRAILEVFIQWFETNEYGWCACGTFPPMSAPTFRFSDFGKTVFLTREEAEAALGGGGDG